MLLFELKTDLKYLKYNATLSSKIWDNTSLKPEVLKALRKIGVEFVKYLNVPIESVVDIIITGSMCNYNYTKYSDIDLHVVLDYDAFCEECPEFDVDDCMKAKKSLWNDRHDISIYGIEVELYAQSKNDVMTGNAGIFSLTKNDWIKRPIKDVDTVYDKRAISRKAEHYMKEIESISDDNVDNAEGIEDCMTRLKNMRKSGLERSGEFSLENLVFKVLRDAGYIQDLYDYQQQVKNDSLSLT